MSAIAPVPAAVHVAPAFAVQVHDWLAMPLAIASFTLVPSAATDPLLLTTTVYVIVPFGVTVEVSAVFVILICGTGGTDAVAVHGAGVFVGVHTPAGGVALAVLARFAGGLALTAAVIVSTT